MGPRTLTFHLLFALHAHLVHSAPPSDPQCPSRCFTWHVLSAVSPPRSLIPCQALPAPSLQSSALLEGRGGQGQCSQQVGCCGPYTSCLFLAACRPCLPSLLVGLLLSTLWACLLAPLWWDSVWFPAVLSCSPLFTVGILSIPAAYYLSQRAQAPAAHYPHRKLVHLLPTTCHRDLYTGTDCLVPLSRFLPLGLQGPCCEASDTSPDSFWPLCVFPQTLVYVHRASVFLWEPSSPGWGHSSPPSYCCPPWPLLTGGSAT